MMTYTSKILILFAMIFMVGGLTQRAEAALSIHYTSGNGFAWANPFHNDLLNKTYSDQLAAMAPDYTFATLDQVKAAAVSDGYGGDLAGVTSWLAAKFFAGVNPSDSGVPCGAPDGCDIRLGDRVGTFYGYALYADFGIYDYDVASDIYVGNSYYSIGALVFKQAPEPTLTLLLGGSLMGLGYVAYQRRKALA